MNFKLPQSIDMQACCSSNITLQVLIEFESESSYFISCSQEKPCTFHVVGLGNFQETCIHPVYMYEFMD